MSTTQTNVVSEDQKLLDILRETPKGTLPFELLKQLESRGSAVVPALIEILKEGISEIRAGRGSDTDQYFFAFALLGIIGDSAALPVMVEAISLPDKMLFRLAGDLVHEHFPQMLAKLSGGDLAAIQALISNRDIENLLRWSIATCYRYMVRDNVISREEAARELEALLNDEMQHPSHELNVGLAQELAYLAFPSSLDVIRRAYQSGNVEDGIISLAELERCIVKPATFKDELDRLQAPDFDLIEDFKRWACFDPVIQSQQKSPTLPEVKPESIRATPDTQSPARGTYPPGIDHRSEKYGRNDPCPCMSGKKYKKCCGTNK